MVPRGVCLLLLASAVSSARDDAHDLHDVGRRGASPAELAVRTPFCPTRQRLARAFGGLRNIELERNHRSDRYFERCAEERIIWRGVTRVEL